VVFLALAGGFALCAPVGRAIAQGATSQAKVMREFHGVSLGQKAEQVHAALGKPESRAETHEEYSLSDTNQVTVHYENGAVKAIQIAFLDPKSAPVWADVVGDAEITQMETGAKVARRVLSAEKFWVSMYQSKDGTITRITISR
jgi:hypothetical protein